MPAQWGYKPTGTKIFDYKGLLFFHLENISRVSGSLHPVSEDQNYLGQDPEQNYYQSVRTLDAFLKPYWDETFISERKKLFSQFKDDSKIKKFMLAVNLLGECIMLMFRKNWLLKEDIEVGRKVYVTETESSRKKVMPSPTSTIQPQS